METFSKLSQISGYLPSRIRSAVFGVNETDRKEIREIRLRLAGKLTVTLGSSEYFLSPDGKVLSTPEKAADITSDDINYVYKLALRDSVHSFRREITRGYITVDGGCRIGFCGTAILDAANGYRIDNIKDISSVNIRIARELKGCADELYNRFFSGSPRSVLIAGPPSSGKTTILRDLVRLLGSRYTVSLIDERSEIACVSDGIPQNDVGAKTDVFSSYNRYEGIMTAVRVMSPMIIAVDEIGSREDLDALEYALHSGVKIIATCHCSALSEMRTKPIIRKLIRMRAFDAAVQLGFGADCGKLIDCCELSQSER